MNNPQKPFQLMTSLAEIKAFHPCSYGWKIILQAKGKREADDTLFPLIECVDSNGFADTCWLLGERQKEIGIVVAAARACVNSVQHLQIDYSRQAAYVATQAADSAARCQYSAAAILAVDAAACAVCAADVFADAADAYFAARAARDEQYKKNLQFLRDAIRNYEAIQQE